MAPILIILVIALIVVSMQYLQHAMILGIDSNFHIQRIYDTAKQIQTGNWSYFQANYGFQQSGRIVNAVYGPYAAYLMGLLLLLVGSWQRFEIVSSFILLVISGTGMYVFSRKAGANKKIATIVGVFYMCSGGYSSSWITGQKFASWGAILVPFVMICGLTMLKDKVRPIHTVTLGASVALLIQFHMLTSIFVIMGLIPFFLVGFLRTSRKEKMLFNLFGAILICLLLTANVWGAYFNLLRAQNLQSPFAVSDLSVGTLHFSFGASALWQSGAIRFLVYVTQVTFVLLNWKKTSFINHTLTISGTFFLILSSNLFPWKAIGKHISMLRSFLQFPARIEVLATVMLLAGLALSITEITSSEKLGGNTGSMSIMLVAIASLVLVFQLMTTITLLSNRWNSDSPIQQPANLVMTRKITADKIRNLFRSSDIDSATKLMAKGAVDYLPAPSIYQDTAGNLKKQSQGTVPYADYIRQIVANKLNVSKYVKQDMLITEWTSKKNGFVQVPIFAYKNTRIVLNGKRLDGKKRIQRTNIGAVIVKARKGDNKLTIQYEPGKTFWILLMTSLIGWGILILFLIWKMVIRSMNLAKRTFISR